tara:strand:+ start:320 stop:1165 length:846 start_codon:yes stop_codon:yes gene_type:complete
MKTKLFIYTLFFNTLFLTAQEFNFDTDESLLINLQNNTEFSTLVEALTLADLIDDLSPENTPQMGYTIFCPTNDAFEAAGIDLSLITSQSQIDVLADVLLNHVTFFAPYGFANGESYTGYLLMANGFFTDPNDYSSWTSYVTVTNDGLDNITVDNANLIFADTRIYGYDANGVAQDACMIQVIDQVLGDFSILLGNQDNELSNAIALYPNPAGEQVTISNGSNITLETAMIYDLNGKLVSQINLQDMQSEQVIDVSSYATGVYMVQITGDQSSVVKRMIKE